MIRLNDLYLETFSVGQVLKAWILSRIGPIVGIIWVYGSTVGLPWPNRKN